MPAGHASQPFVLSKSSTCSPAGQLRHAELPVVLAYVALAHELHMPWVLVPEYLPTTQSEHVDEPLAELCPGSQSVHPVCCPAKEYFPT